MKKWKHPVLHIALWGLLLINNIQDGYKDKYIAAAIQSSGLNKALFLLLFHSGYLLVFMIAFYGSYFFVGPLLFIQKKYIKAAFYMLAVLVVMVLSRYLVEFHLLLSYLKFNNYLGHTPDIKYYIENCVFYTYKYCLAGLVVYFLVASHKIEEERKQIEKEKIQAELSFLRSQINPHFLFNAINDIYALTYQKNDQAPEALLKLSSMLRYMLGEGAADKVKLAKEIAYLQDYIELQRIGLKNQLYFDFLVEGEIDNQQISPLLLIPFAENIFKHGVINDPLYPAQLKITLQNQHFQIFSINKIAYLQKDSLGGIGLNNVRRRLELLYPDEFTFKVTEKENLFQCHLQLNL